MQLEASFFLNLFSLHAVFTGIYRSLHFPRMITAIRCNVMRAFDMIGIRESCYDIAFHLSVPVAL